MEKKIDYLVIGQGLAGSAVAWELLQAHKSFIVVNKTEKNTASTVAAGLFNPVTGRVMTKTWNADLLFPELKKFYSTAENILKIKFFFPRPIYRPFISAEERSQWRTKSTSPVIKDYVKVLHEHSNFGQFVNDDFGGIEINHSGFLHVNTWMLAVRQYLHSQDCYREEYFDEHELVDRGNEGFYYKGLIIKKLIFCNGLSAKESRWFHWVPIIPLKGETLDIKADLPQHTIFNRGVYLVGDEGHFKVGATYEHAPYEKSVTSKASDELQSRLRSLLKIPFEVLHQDWGIRPTSPDRRPILGNHPANKNVVLFNGLGTKGVSLAPYFAQQLIQWLEGGSEPSPEVNIYRFKTLYSG